MYMDDYKRWLETDLEDPALTEELKSIDGQDGEIKDRFAVALKFGTASEWAGWISLQSKGLSRVFSNTTVQKHQFFGLSLLHSPTLTSIHDHRKNHSLD